MMGRYFPYRVHPFSVAELLDVSLPTESLIRKPHELPDDDWRSLNEFGGFPDPFLKRDRRFARRWNTLRFEQMTQSDLRDLTKVMELDQLSAISIFIICGTSRSARSIFWLRSQIVRGFWWK